MTNTDDRIGAVLLTALELEHHAVREHLTDLQVWIHPAGTLFELGTIQGTRVRVALAVTGEGNQAAAILTERASTAFVPDLVLFVGIAGGLRTDVAIGDVVVATRVYGYHGGKESAAGFSARPRAWDTPHHLEQHARYLARTPWWQRLLPRYSEQPFRIHFKPVVAGEVVLDSPSSALAERLRHHYNDAAAVEMESAGASLAALINRSLPLLTIRGISDLADGEKTASDSAGWQSMAASRAAAFALAFVLSVETAAVDTIDGPAPAMGRGSLRRRADSAEVVGPDVTGQRPFLTGSRGPAMWQRHAFVDHDRLFGVGDLVSEVCQAICSGAGHLVVSLFGEGGIGKTAVAHDAVAASTAAGAFGRIAWTSAAGNRGAFDPAPKVGQMVYWLDILKDLADQLDFELGMSRTLWTERFRHQMAAFPSNERALIVIDNIETIEDATSAISSLRSIGVDHPHKLLVTTRWQVQPMMAAVTEYRLGPLDDASAIELIRHLGLRDRHLRNASDNALRPILEVTAGNPFLIKLAIRQYLSSHLPLDRLLHEFRDLRGTSSRGGTLAGHLRSHLYLRSLRELERRFGAEAVSALMSSFCAKGRGDAFTYDDLMTISGLDTHEVFPGILSAACQLSLVTAFGDPTMAERLDRAYTIHSLLHEFTCGQLADGGEDHDA